MAKRYLDAELVRVSNRLAHNHMVSADDDAVMNAAIRASFELGANRRLSPPPGYDAILNEAYHAAAGQDAYLLFMQRLAECQRLRAYIAMDLYGNSL